MKLPDNLPPLPPVPEGFDRWEYRGTNYGTNGAPSDHLCINGWYRHQKGFDLTMPIDASPYSHVIEAVRDQPQSCSECVQGYVQETGFDRCEKCNPEPATGVEARVCEDVLTPFRNVARGIPDNWPGDCILRFDQRADGSLFLSYYGVNDASNGITVDQWRKLLPDPPKNC